MVEELKQALLVATGIEGFQAFRLTKSGMILEFAHAAALTAFMALVDAEKVECVAFNSTFVGVVKR